MNAKSPETMKRISRFIDQYYADRHMSPSLQTIAEGVGIHKSTVMRYLREMDEQGMLSYEGKAKKIVTPMISKCSSASAAFPIVGAIPCGPAEEEEENILEYVSLPVSVFGSGEFYILKASGDSMADAGIDDGDLVVIKKTTEAYPGDIVVALDGEGQNTLKKLGKPDRKRGEAVLLYQNEAMYPGREIRVKELVIQGVAKHVIKSL